jgi:hypothetical protein
MLQAHRCDKTSIKQATAEAWQTEVVRVIGVMRLEARHKEVTSRPLKAQRK